MCLMCEHYFDSCTESGCVEKAKAGSYKMDEYYLSNTGLTEWFLWKGLSEPCEHIRADHTEDCNVVVRKPSKYGSMYWNCDCDKE